MKVENLGKLCKLNMVKKKIPPPNEQIYIYILYTDEAYLFVY